MKHKSRASQVATIILSILLTMSWSMKAVTFSDLGTAGTFTILGGSAVTSTGASIINGNLGVDPGTSITGFPPGTVINGSIIINGAAATAHADTVTAFNLLAGAPLPTSLTGLDLGGLTLTPGVYNFTSSAQLTGTLKLDNTLDPTGTYVFQIASTLTTASASAVVLLGSADPNIFWQVGSSATFGSGTIFNGNILSDISITFNPGASLAVGRALAINGAVTMAGGNTMNLSFVPIIPPSIPSTATFWNGNASNLWSGVNWSPDATGATNDLIAVGANVVFSVTGVVPQNQTTSLDVAESIASLTVNDPAAVTISGPNLLTITGPTDTRSSITINSGAGLTTINSNIFLGANTSSMAGVAVDNTAGLVINGVISGANGLTKQGTGALTLSNANIYTGSTTFGLVGDLTAGTVIIGNGATDGSTSTTPTTITPFGATTVTVNAVTTLTTDGAATGNSYTLANNFILMPPLTVNVPTATSLTMSGTITGVDGLFVNVPAGSTGQLILTGGATGNTYSGSTQLFGGKVQAGTLSGTGKAFSPNSDFSLSGSSVLDLNGNNETIASLTGIAGTIVTNGANGPASLTINDSNSSIVGTPKAYTFGGSLTDAGKPNALSVIKQGPGTLILTGDTTGNTYSGSTQLQGGKVQAGTLSGTGKAFSPNSDYTLSGSSVLDLNGNNETVASLTGVAGTTVTNGANGPATLTINDSNSSIVGTPKAYTFGGSLTDAGKPNALSLIKQGPGTLTLTGDATGNTYSGSTQLQGGKVQAGTLSGTGKAFSPNSDFMLSGTSVLDLNGNNETIASLSGVAGTTVTNGANGPATLTINDSNSSLLGSPKTYTFGGSLIDAGKPNALSLVKQGPGTLILMGDVTGNTYSGSTQLQGGKVLAGTLSGTGKTFSPNSDYTLSGSSVLDLNGNNETIASLSGVAGTTVTNGANGPATLTINDSNSSLLGSPKAYTFGGSLTDAGSPNALSLVKQGAGSLTLTGANTYTGSTSFGVVGDLTAGSVIIGNGATDGSTFTTPTTITPFGTTTVTVNAVSTLTTDGATTGNSYTLNNNFVLAPPLTVNVPSATSLTMSGTITGVDGLFVNVPAGSTGQLILTGGATGNTYSGSTQLFGGKVQAGTLSGTGKAFSPNSDFTLSGTSVLDLNGNNQTIASLSGAAGTIVTNGANGPAALTINDSNSSIVGTPKAYTFGGILTDAGKPNALSVIKQGPGTLVLTGDATGNTYSGSTQLLDGKIQAGTLSGTGKAFSPNSDFALNGSSVLDLNGNNQTIASLSGVAGTTVTNGANGPTALTINDSNSSIVGSPKVYEFNGTLTDAGSPNALSLVKQGTGTLTLTGANTHTGSTTISAGTLVVGSATPGSHLSTALGRGNVINAGTLKTTASLPGKTGSTTQRIQVLGNYTQTATGTLMLQVVSSPNLFESANTGVAGTNYDTLTVGGAAFLGGTLNLNFAPATVPSPGQHYVAVTAAAPLTSQFQLPTQTNLASFDPTFYTITTYNDTFGGSQPADSAIVTLLHSFATCAPDLTPNQTQVALNVDHNLNVLGNSGSLLIPTGAAKDFFDNIVTGLNIACANGTLGLALNELSPQRFQILRNVAFDNYALDLQNLDNELARERNGQGGIDTSGFAIYDSQLGTQLSQIKSRLQAWTPNLGLGLLGGGEMNAPSEINAKRPEAPLNRWNGFLDGGADLGDLDSNRDVNNSSYTTGRVRGGLDYRVSTTVRVGAVFGYGHTEADLDNEGSKAKIDSYTPGLYAAYADKKGFYVNSLATYTRNDYDTTRRIIIPGVNRTASGSTGGNQFGGDINGGYEFHRKNWTFGPNLGLTYVNLAIDRINENGAGVANLYVNQQSAESLRTRLGGTVRYAAPVGSIVLTPHASAFWQHELLNGSQPITSGFQGLPGGAFTIQTTKLDSDTALLGFGLDAELDKTVTLFVDYQAEAGGSTFFGQSASMGVKIGF